MEDELPYMDSNIIDLSLLSSPCSTVAEEEMEKLKSYLLQWGCFQITNAGLSTEFLKEVCDTIKHFFSLPSHEKDKYSRTPDNPQGYGIDGDPINPSQATSRLLLTIFPDNQQTLDRWPKTPHYFREKLCDYSTTVQRAHDQVVRAMAKLLDKKDDVFVNGYGKEPQSVARINYYPPCPNIDQVRRVSRHADVSCMTFLLTDRDVEALEILKDDQWFKVPIIPHAIVVLVGDQMEMMSNGMLRSPEHRVKPNVEKERVSVALFFSPDLEKQVGPLKEFVTENQPAHYKTVRSYINLFEGYYTRGIRPITAVKM